jgi:hypothetical protein
LAVIRRASPRGSIEQLGRRSSPRLVLEVE